MSTPEEYQFLGRSNNENESGGHQKNDTLCPVCCREYGSMCQCNNIIDVDESYEKLDDYSPSSPAGTAGVRTDGEKCEKCDQFPDPPTTRLRDDKKNGLRFKCCDPCWAAYVQAPVCDNCNTLDAIYCCNHCTFYKNVCAKCKVEYHDQLAINANHTMELINQQVKVIPFAEDIMVEFINLCGNCLYSKNSTIREAVMQCKKCPPHLNLFCKECSALHINFRLFKELKHNLTNIAEIEFLSTDTANAVTFPPLSAAPAAASSVATNEHPTVCEAWTKTASDILSGINIQQHEYNNNPRCDVLKTVSLLVRPVYVCTFNVEYLVNDLMLKLQEENNDFSILATAIFTDRIISFLSMMPSSNNNNKKRSRGNDSKSASTLPRAVKDKAAAVNNNQFDLPFQYREDAVLFEYWLLQLLVLWAFLPSPNTVFYSAFCSIKFEKLNMSVSSFFEQKHPYAIKHSEVRDNWDALSKSLLKSLHQQIVDKVTTTNDNNHSQEADDESADIAMLHFFFQTIEKHYYSRSSNTPDLYAIIKGMEIKAVYGGKRTTGSKKDRPYVVELDHETYKKLAIDLVGTRFTLRKEEEEGREVHESGDIITNNNSIHQLGKIAFVPFQPTTKSHQPKENSDTKDDNDEETVPYISFDDYSVAVDFQNLLLDTLELCYGRFLPRATSIELKRLKRKAEELATGRNRPRICSLIKDLLNKCTTDKDLDRQMVTRTIVPAQFPLLFVSFGFAADNPDKLNRVTPTLQRQSYGVMVPQEHFYRFLLNFEGPFAGRVDIPRFDIATPPNFHIDDPNCLHEMERCVLESSAFQQHNDENRVIQVHYCINYRRAYEIATAKGPSCFVLQRIPSSRQGFEFRYTWYFEEVAAVWDFVPYRDPISITISETPNFLEDRLYFGI